VNNFGGGLQPNPPRVLVFETKGDGSDIMGVDDGAGGYRPNAQWTITNQNNAEIRPFRWLINDIDQDGTDEILASLRSGTPRFHVYSVNNVPDNADSSETWSLEFAGPSATSTDNYDLAIIDSTVYVVRSNGNVTSFIYSASGDSFRVGRTQNALVPGGSWKTSSVADIDGDGIKEIVIAGSFGSAATNQVWLLQQEADSLKRTQLLDLPTAAGRIFGGAAGDIDRDGRIDFVFGSRESTPNGLIHRLEYKGGAIIDPNSYQLTRVDSLIAKPTQYDVIVLANVDRDPALEILYTGTPRGNAVTDPPQPLAILDLIPGNQPIITDVQDVPNDQGRQVRVTWVAAEDDVGGLRLSADLSGANEVPPAATVASGKATFILHDDRQSLSFLVTVFNIDSVAQAHIHRGPPGVNGPVGVFLFGPATPGGPVNGVLSSGTITAANLVGPWAGNWEGFLADLLTGNTYANVHTKAYPGGEIRGQVLAGPPPANLSKPKAGLTITEYSVWRKIDVGRFEQVGSTKAVQLPEYSLVVPTLFDGDTTSSTYVVVAHTPSPLVHFESLAKSGFSLDNLIPSAPTSVVAKEGGTPQGQPAVLLNWDESPDADFKYFAVVRGTASGFDPTTAPVIGAVTENQFTDADVSIGASFFYRIVAFDFNGNRGVFSAEVSLTITAVDERPTASLPTEFALRQNYPNPFNPSTQIAYDLASPRHVSLKIFNTMGQVVKTLVDSEQPAGRYTITWDGTSEAGTRVASGVYLYIIKAGDFVQSRRLTVLK
jgi:hypothetical protein